MSLAFEPGCEHEGRRLIPLLRSISIKHGRGRPRKNQKRVYADTKYHVRLNRFYLDNRKDVSQIPRTATKKRPGRPGLLDKETCQGARYSMERSSAWREDFRRPKIRYEKAPRGILGIIPLVMRDGIVGVLR
jgi:hypothetical protein